MAVPTTQKATEAQEQAHLRGIEPSLLAGLIDDAEGQKEALLEREELVTIPQIGRQRSYDFHVHMVAPDVLERLRKAHWRKTGNAGEPAVWDDVGYVAEVIFEATRAEERLDLWQNPKLRAKYGAKATDVVIGMIPPQGWRDQIKNVIYMLCGYGAGQQVTFGEPNLREPGMDGPSDADAPLEELLGK